MNAKAISLKTLFAAGALALGLAAALPAPAAHADMSVGIGLGVYPPAPAAAGWGGYAGGDGAGYGGGYGAGYGGNYGGGYGGNYGGGYGGAYGGYDGGYGGAYRRPAPAYDGWVSCRDGRRILYRYGYQGIEVQSCRPGFYRYTAWRNGKHYLVAVDGQGGVNKLGRIY